MSLSAVSRPPVVIDGMDAGHGRGGSDTVTRGSGVLRIRTLSSEGFGNVVRGQKG
jgi:hypothetical protein